MLPNNADDRSDPLQNRESRCLKVVGLVLIIIVFFVAFPVLVLQDQRNLKEWSAYQHMGQFLSRSFVAANALAMGLIVLLAGLKKTPLLSDVQAKRGALLKMVGANLLILTFGFVFLGDYPPFSIWKRTWIGLPLLVLLLVAMKTGIRLL